MTRVYGSTGIYLGILWPKPGSPWWRAEDRLAVCRIFPSRDAAMEWLTDQERVEGAA